MVLRLFACSWMQVVQVVLVVLVVQVVQVVQVMPKQPINISSSDMGHHFALF